MSGASSPGIDYDLVVTVLIASTDPAAELRAFVAQERENARYDLKCEALALISEYALLLDPSDDWPEGGFEDVIKAAGARHAARIVEGITT